MSEDKLTAEERKNIMDKFNRVFSKSHNNDEDLDIIEDDQSNNISCLIIPQNPAVND